MMNPLIDQIAASHIEELRLQAAQASLAERTTLRDWSRMESQRVKSRLGSYLVDRGQRLLTTSTPHPGSY
jgi:hypothetical protein